MNAIELLHIELKWAHELLDLVMQDVTPGMAAWKPPGTANPLGATYAHAVFSEDAVVNIALRGGIPLYEGDWRGRTGIENPQWGIEFEWARSLTVDLDAMRTYAQAVYASSESYLAEIDEADLDREVDLTSQDLGVQTVGRILTALVASHLNNMAGEISVLKGLQGGKGYPF